MTGDPSKDSVDMNQTQEAQNSGDEKYRNLLKQVEAEKDALTADLQIAQKMEAVAVLAGGLAHDFNNLLFAIMGSVELAKLQATGRQLQQLSRAYDSCLKARDLVSRFLELSASSMSAKKPASIAPLIRDIIATREKFKKHISYSLNIRDDLKPVTYVCEQMILAIRYLISNAEESMPGGGVVKIIAENMKLTETKTLGQMVLQPGNYVRISVLDQGAGISPENLEKILDPYFSTKNQTMEKGCGLGLSIVSAIVKRHKGNIAIESQPDKGTKVIVYLPAA